MRLEAGPQLLHAGVLYRFCTRVGCVVRPRTEPCKSELRRFIAEVPGGFLQSVVVTLTFSLALATWSLQLSAVCRAVTFTIERPNF